MKIAVCIPSFNEAHNIQNITQTVDQGLTDLIRRYPEITAEVINFDSSSTDDTSNIFLRTNTYSPKKSFIIEDAPGKGKNILEFCKYAVENKIDYCITIDSDIISATPEWITTLLQPLIKENADYVTPIYQRSRFEGSSTNHFAFPLIFAVTGKIIRQPIAGDFAFTNKLAKAISQSALSKMESIQKYGIDIFMTVTAIAIGGKIEQVVLGKKLHAPSFNKLEYMFPQIATAAMISVRNIDLQKRTQEISGTKSNVLADITFSHKNEAREMWKNALVQLNQTEVIDWTSANKIKEYIRISSDQNISEEKMVEIWTDVLADWIRYFLERDSEHILSREAGKTLLPFFVLRAVNFWFWSEHVEIDEVEKAIINQAEMLRDKVRKQ